jgi:hypothetical protein
MDEVVGRRWSFRRRDRKEARPLLRNQKRSKRDRKTFYESMLPGCPELLILSPEIFIEIKERR